MYALPGPGSRPSGGTDPVQQSTGELLADIFSTASAVRGQGRGGPDQMDWPVHTNPSTGSTGSRIETGDVNSSAPASVHEEDTAPVGNSNAPGVWLDFLSAPTAAGVSSGNDDGSVPHHNSTPRVSSASTPVVQAHTPVTEGSDTGGRASTSGPSSELQLFGMQPRGGGDAETVEDKQGSGRAGDV